MVWSLASLRFSPMVAAEGFGAGAPETFGRNRGATLFPSRALFELGPIAPLRFRRWLRVKVSGQGPPKPSPAAEAQRRSCGVGLWFRVCLRFCGFNRVCGFGFVCRSCGVGLRSRVCLRFCGLGFVCHVA